MILLFSFHTFFLLFNLLPSSLWAIRTELCEQVSLTFRGRDLLETAKGQIVLVAFTKLVCPRCENQLTRLSSLQESNSDERIGVLAPNWESYATVGRLQQRFPRILIDKDTTNNYRTLGAQDGDVVVIDKCGRLAQVIKSARSDMASYTDVVDALKSAKAHAICGFCTIPASSSGRMRSSHATDHPPFKGVNVYMKPHTEEQLRRMEARKRYDEAQKVREQERQRAAAVEQQRRINEQQYQTSSFRTSTNTIPPTTNVNHHTSSQWGNQGSRTQSQASNNKNIDYDEWKQSPGLGQILFTTPYPASRNAPPTNPPRAPTSPMILSAIRTTTTTTTPGPTTRSKYGEDYDYYSDDGTNPAEVRKTQRVETQIPPPTRNVTSAATQANIPLSSDDVFAGGENIPCSAYTEDVCYHQQEKFGHEHLSKCCTKGIYFTDLCVPGKCSNSTVQLCCLQQFLQARYQCCQDESQSDANTATDKFSRCCHRNFIEENSCCPVEAAKKYWETAQEVCFPNTKVNLSNIRHEVRFSEGVRVVDLGQNRLWDHECQHGSNRVQFSYIP